MAIRTLLVLTGGLALLGCGSPPPAPLAPAPPTAAPAPYPEGAVEVERTPEAGERAVEAAPFDRTGPGGCPLAMGGPAKWHEHWLAAGLYPPRLVLREAHELGLTDAQLAKLKQDLFDTRAKSIEARARGERARLEVMRLMSAPKPDQQAIGRRIDEAAAAHAEQRKVWLGLLLRTRELLTPDQRAKLDLERSRHHQGAEMRREHGRRWERGMAPDEGEDWGPSEM